jgi:uncharacterized protein involved in exopolysaccharide biosynthesis
MTNPRQAYDVRPRGEEPASAILADWVSSAVASVLRTGARGVASTLLGAAAGVAIALTLPAEYTATASFIARGASASLLPTALQGLAASVGIGAARDYSPQFYADLVTSDPVLVATVARSYRVTGPGRVTSQSYSEIEGISGKDPAQATDAAIRHLRRRVAARADVRTNIISISVTARYPEVSHDVAQALLDALDSMNITFRREQSRELREFFQSQVAEAQRELDSTEKDLRVFLERNRVTQGSPLLTFEQTRLTRVAELKRAVYTTVVQQYEEAKLQEARNVPVLTVLAPPTVPVRKSGPPRRLIVVAGILLGLLAAMGWDPIRSLSSRLSRSRR